MVMKDSEVLSVCDVTCHMKYWFWWL